MVRAARSAGLSRGRRVDSTERDPGKAFDEMLSSAEFSDHYQDASNRALAIRQLLEARKAAGRSQSQVAKDMRTTQSAVSDLEGGATDPRFSTLQRYARAVGARVDIAIARDPALIPLSKAVTETFVAAVPLQKAIDFETAPELVKAS